MHACMQALFHVLIGANAAEDAENMRSPCCQNSKLGKGRGREGEDEIGGNIMEGRRRGEGGEKWCLWVLQLLSAY